MPTPHSATATATTTRHGSSRRESHQPRPVTGPAGAHDDGLVQQGPSRHGITVAFDNDPAGRAATLRAWQLLPIGAGVDLHAARLPDNADPADLIAANQTATLRAALTHAIPLVEAVIDLRLGQLVGYHPDLLDHPGGQVMATRALAQLLIDLPPEQIVALADRIAARTAVGLDTVANEVIDAIEQAPPRGTGLPDRGHPPPARPSTPTPAAPSPRTPASPQRPARHGRAFPPPGTPDRDTTRPATTSHPVPGITARPSRR